MLFIVGPFNASVFRQEYCRILQECVELCFDAKSLCCEIWHGDVMQLVLGPLVHHSGAPVGTR